ncbi:N-acetyl-gamma-glutamyl-phosphate reductase [Agromyces flavus]|uniref:N-acetyl-gamma-glutamyl-phosphate reductase n=1 Tax=Agromyces flavus TaxID=589382 RepID=A0A1H1SV13_9MICO|nr:N-acetyl-gamma-glutamyl-phosphate reductase [Agromyces flavus]MCP2369290.1 N-acetyl-gamma-glutamyl-phosphate reductase [Agromyces flavus]GGI48736.1 N-acetyl-gamma-glutamyl-phosphate reductase [Agromyces flavus]SDS51830.1 N-acetyl-gamma-glutamyl-phosphate reductase [Agromyces flavus]
MTFTVAVSGASGYAGGELLRLLADHPEFEVRTVTAHANAGQPLSAVQPHLRGYTHLTLKETSTETLAGHDVVFLALPHGASGAIAAELGDDTLVIDCGADHRLESEQDWADFYGGDFHGTWEYGVPELPRMSGTQRTRLAKTRRIAAPGCNASTVALSLAPGIRAGVIEDRDIVSVLAVGPSGAGRALKAHLLGSEILGSANPYAVGGTHRHIPEIQQALRWAGAAEPTISFTPTIVPMSRGILATSTARIVPGTDAATVRAAWEDAYAGEQFVQLLPDGQFPRTADVLGANTALLGLAVDEAAGRVVVVAAVDNLVKGTAGAAIQSANIALGLAEATGLPVNGVAP